MGDMDGRWQERSAKQRNLVFCTRLFADLRRNKKNLAFSAT
jgi:hypothetical protein